MNIYFAIDSDSRVIGFSLYPHPELPKQAVLADEQFADFVAYYSDYCYRDNQLEKQVNLTAAKTAAKARCTELFEIHYQAAFPETEPEKRLAEAIREELRLYVRDNQMPTPVTDSLATALGVEDKHAYRLAWLDNILHHDITLAHLVAQKTQMFGLIEQCDDGEAIHSMEFNFSYPTYSNMRWR